MTIQAWNFLKCAFRIILKLCVVYWKLFFNNDRNPCPCTLPRCAYLIEYDFYSSSIFTTTCLTFSWFAISSFYSANFNRTKSLLYSNLSLVRFFPIIAMVLVMIRVTYPTSNPEKWVFNFLFFSKFLP